MKRQQSGKKGMLLVVVFFFLIIISGLMCILLKNCLYSAQIAYQRQKSETLYYYAFALKEYLVDTKKEELFSGTYSFQTPFMGYWPSENNKRYYARAWVDDDSQKRKRVFVELKKNEKTVATIPFFL